MQPLRGSAVTPRLRSGGAREYPRPPAARCNPFGVGGERLFLFTAKPLHRTAGGRTYSGAPPERRAGVTVSTPKGLHRTAGGRMYSCAPPATDTGGRTYSCTPPERAPWVGGPSVGGACRRLGCVGRRLRGTCRRRRGCAGVPATPGCAIQPLRGKESWAGCYFCGNPSVPA
jgi:hypothetical protein